MMERSDPLLLLIALPSIPAALIWAKLARWEDWAARNFGWLLHSVCPWVFEQPAENHVFAEQPTSPSRILCGALIFPTIATLIGRFLLGRVKSNLNRTVLGGVLFIGIKGILRIYYKLKHNEQYQKREIMDAPVIYIQYLIPCAWTDSNLGTRVSEKWILRKINRPINQSTNQSINQPTNQ